MNMTEKIEILERNRPLILITEIAGLLHDLGKLDNECFRHHNERIRSEFKVDGVKREDMINKDEIPLSVWELFREKKLPEIFANEINKNVLDFLCSGKEPEVFSPIFYHHAYLNPRNNYEKIIALADSQDSSEDRGAIEGEDMSPFFIATPFGFEENLDEKFEKKLEKLKAKDRREARKKFYEEFDFELQKNLKKNIFRKNALKLIEKYFSISLAETRRPANDINLYDHSYMTGSISKAVLSGCFLDEEYLEEIGSKLEKGNYFDFKLLVVGFRGHEFLTNVYRLPDFAGRGEKLEEIRKEVKKLIEVDYPIGNLVYEDLEVMCFLIPGLKEKEVENKIEEEFREKIEEEFNERSNGILFPFVRIIGKDDEDNPSSYIGPLLERAKKIRQEMNALYSYIPDRGLRWMEEWNKQYACFDCNQVFSRPKRKDKKEVCPACNSSKIKRREKCQICGYAPEWPIEEGVISTRGEKLCKYCYDIRLRGGKKRHTEEKGTIWLDELGDENNNIALIVGKMTPIQKWLSGEFVKETMKTIYACPPDVFRNIRKEKTFWKRNNLKLLKYYFELKRKISELETFTFPKRIEEIINILRGLSSLIKKRLIEDIRIEGRSVIHELFRLSREIKEATDEIYLKEKRIEFTNKLKILVDRLYERITINGDAKNFLEGISEGSEENEKILTEISSKKWPSPSRLRRIWQEFLEFSEYSETSLKNFFEEQKLIRKRIKMKVDGEIKKKEYMLGDAKLEGKDIGCVIYEGERTILTANYLDTEFEFDGEKQKLNEYSKEDLKDLLKGKILEIKWYDGTSTEAKIEEVVNIEPYIPVVPVYKTVGEFMFLCPAKYALTLTTRIKAHFFKRFEKALGKLGLNIGLLYFKYKQPLYLVLDGGRRFIEEFESEDLRKEDETREYEILKNEDLFIVDKLGWNITPKFEDGSEDWYYCTLKDAITNEYVPILKMKNNKIKVFHNYFDYEYMESTQKRFDITFGERSKRFHSVVGEQGPRPYLLEDVGKIIKLWDIINPEKGNLTISQIMKLKHICSEKIEEWGLKNKDLRDEGTFRTLVEASVENICGDIGKSEKETIIRSVIEGYFFDVVELFIKLEQILSPFDVISFFADFQYNKEEGKRAERWLLKQVGGLNANP